MLPGFRFLFAAIVLSMSILVFGLGAAALLRAAHEEFAGKPLWHAAPETNFAQQGEATRPVLTMLRVEPAAEPAAPDNLPAAPVAVATAPAEPERVAAPNPPEPSPPETAKPEMPAELPSALGDEAPADKPAPDGESRMASVLPLAGEPTPAAPEQTSAQVLTDTGLAATKVATLGGPAVTIEPPAAKPDRKKRRRSLRASQRRRMALRARLEGQTLQPQGELFPGNR